MKERWIQECLPDKEYNMIQKVTCYTRETLKRVNIAVKASYITIKEC